ncbi:related to triacylglycerol lipase II precursor [Ramularia collo-cygni]|uniref:Related to triacylglycerol lipase II n=1 Tax=Ramularia collo-cygni TaxID=112498 RepID=A0A2D3UQR1_9PEZI|nr:related to triacylglycerol lipase II precursor [Ramularia collo-cygni]CZT18161.1 related to triacylglycerol lipase II precursor [Ramularia collo-cygni]
MREMWSLLAFGAFVLQSAATTLQPSVRLTQGVVSGKYDASNNSVFLGIPYAATTAGENRWKAPQPLSLSKYSALNATAYGPTCPQAVTNAYYSRQDEDCLNLNIWTPARGENKKLPVFVYTYGGAMVTGSNSDPQHQGFNFARKGVVYVNLNTRESLWASPNSADLPGSQNFGILDVDMAMEWIHTNIAHFGGDPNHIVFGGHSSGAVHVDHYLWNHPSTWLKGAVQMSANALSGPAFAPKNVALDVVAAEVGCGTVQQGGQLECLRSVEIADLQTAFFNQTSNTWFTPIIDDITRFSDYPARLKAGKYASHVPLLTGNSAGEGTIFSLVYGAENANFSSWIETFNADSKHIPSEVLLSAYAHNSTSDSSISGMQYGEARFDCPVDYMIDLRSECQSTWEYRFFGAYDNVVGVPGTAPTHGTEVPFFLGGNECFEKLENVTAAQQALADSIHDWFVAWIKNPGAGPGWERARAVDGPIAYLGFPGDELSQIEASSGLHNGRCQEVYKPYFGDYPVVQTTS